MMETAKPVLIAIRLPSGDQSGDPWPSWILTGGLVVPSALMTHTPSLTPSVRSNAIFVPSGDHDGLVPPSPVMCVSWTRCEPSSASMTAMFLPAVNEVKAIRVPSGDHAGVVPVSASFLRLDPSAPITQRPGLRSSAIRVPSGDQASDPVKSPVRIGVTLPPSASMSCTLLERVNAIFPLAPGNAARGRWRTIPPRWRLRRAAPGSVVASSAPSIARTGPRVTTGDHQCFAGVSRWSARRRPATSCR